MFDLSPIQLIIVLVIAVLVLGPTRLPAFSRAVGRGVRDLRNALGGDPHDDLPGPPPTPAARAAPVTTATAGPPEQPSEAPDVLEGIVVSGDSPPPGRRPAPGPNAPG